MARRDRSFSNRDTGSPARCFSKSASSRVSRRAVALSSRVRGRGAESLHAERDAAGRARCRRRVGRLDGVSRRSVTRPRAARPHQPLTARWRAINRARSRTRARGEHPFHVVKRLWGFAKVRYRGIAKNLARAFSLFALANLYRVRRQLLPPQARCVL
jgi:Transposase DDE domain